mgnify:CR=1 FL=1
MSIRAAPIRCPFLNIVSLMFGLISTLFVKSVADTCLNVSATSDSEYNCLALLRFATSFSTLYESANANGNKIAKAIF